MTDGWRAAVVECVRAEALPVDKFGHMPRLYALTVRLGAGIEFDDDVVFAAAWMHDLGVFVGNRPSDPAELAKWDHVPYTVARARELLVGWGFPAEKLDAVAEAIKTHQPQDEPVSMEAVLLRDADILEQLGAVTVLRTVCKIGRDTRFKIFPDALRVLQKNADTLPAQLKLEASRKLAGPRVLALQQFLAAAQVEGCAEFS